MLPLKVLNSLVEFKLPLQLSGPSKSFIGKPEYVSLCLYRPGAQHTLE
jgi:hypothetical protein